MNLLETVIRGKTPKAPKILLYGFEGCGKSTWASQAPNPIFVQTEDGLNQIDCAKFPLAHSYQEVMNALVSVRDEEHDFQTVVVDSLSGLEPLIWAEVCRQYGVKTIEKVDGGYGKGYTIACDWWMQFRDLLQQINDKRNMMIILIAHSGIQTIKDPETSTYDRTAPRLHRLAEGILSQWSDCVFQAKQKFRIQKTAEGFGSERAIAAPVGSEGGERVLRTIGNAAVIAKNRYGIPEEIPLDFSIVMNYISKNINSNTQENTTNG